MTLHLTLIYLTCHLTGATNNLTILSYCGIITTIAYFYLEVKCLASTTKIIEKLEYLTDIMTSYDGHEQRVCLRQEPRYTYSYDYSAMNQWQAQWLRQQGGILSNKLWYLPMWHKPGYLIESTIANARVLYMDEDYMYNFLDAEYVYIFSGDDHTQRIEGNLVRKVASYADGMIRLQKKIPRPLDMLNTWVFPVKQVNTLTPTNIDYRFANGTEITQNFEDMGKKPGRNIPNHYIEDYDTDIDDFNRFNIEATYNGKEVFRHAPNWIGDGATTLTIEKNEVRLDNTTGQYYYDLRNNKPLQIHAVNYFMLNQNHINNLKKFFIKVKGRCHSFYTPSWVNDFEVHRPVIAGTNYFYTDLAITRRLMQGIDKKKRVIVFFRDWTYEIHEVYSNTSEILDDGNEYGKITFTDDWQRNAQVDDIWMVSYFNLVRLDSDELQINYESNISAGVTLTFREVLDEE